MEKITAKRLAQLGMLVGIEIVCTRFFAIETTFIRLSFSFIPLIMMGYLFGPVWAGLGGVAGDVVGMLLFPKAAYFFGFTINAFLEPFIYGLFFHNKEVTFKRNLMAQLTVMVVISLCLTPLWLNIMYKHPFLELMPIRIAKESIIVPIKLILTQMIFSRKVIYNTLRANR